MHVYLIYINPRALIYGESVCVMRPITCFRVNFRVNNLYNRQKAVETMPPVPTPRTFTEKPELIKINKQILNTYRFVLVSDINTMI